jgi:drug/metabolite transporter (DMT)-like permease
MLEPSPAPRSQLYPVLVLVSASVLWGLTWMPLKYFGGFGLQGVTVTLVAHGSVGLLALGWLSWRFSRWRSAAGGLLALAACGSVANLSFASAIVSGDVVRVMVLFYLLPAWGVLGGWLLLGERVDAFRKLSVGGALCGAVLILGGPSVLTRAPSGADVLAVLSGLALALNNVLFRKLDHLAVAEKTAAMFAGCLVLALSLTLLGVQPAPSDVPFAVWLKLAAFGLVWLAIATAGTQWGVAHMEAGKSSVLIIMELVTAVLSAAVVSGSKPSALEWAGGALVVAASLIEARRPAPTLEAGAKT